MNSALTTEFVFVTHKQRTSILRKINTYNLQVEHNKQHINDLTLKIKDTCCINKPLVLQNDCKDLHLKIEDLCDNNRRINVLKRNIYRKYGIDWDEEYN